MSGRETYREKFRRKTKPPRQKGWVHRWDMTLMILHARMNIYTFALLYYVFSGFHETTFAGAICIFWQKVMLNRDWVFRASQNLATFCTHQLQSHS